MIIWKQRIWNRTLFEFLNLWRERDSVLGKIFRIQALPVFKSAFLPSSFRYHESFTAIHWHFNHFHYANFHLACGVSSAERIINVFVNVINTLKVIIFKAIIFNKIFSFLKEFSKKTNFYSSSNFLYFLKPL